MKALGRYNLDVWHAADEASAIETAPGAGDGHLQLHD
jgi:hypothetical protein